jgi:hypothetical protein
MGTLALIEAACRPVLPDGAYASLLYHSGLGHGGAEWQRRRVVVHFLHEQALEQERSGVPAEEIFARITETLANNGIGSVLSKNVFAPNADHDEGVFPLSLIAQNPGHDRDPHPCGVQVYYAGEAAERDQYPEEFLI